MTDNILTDQYRYDPNYHRLASFLGLDEFTRLDFNVAKKLAFLYDWAKEKIGRDDPNSIVNELSNLERKLGIHDIGETLLKQLYRSARFESLPDERVLPKQEEKKEEEVVDDGKLQDNEKQIE